MFKEGIAKFLKLDQIMERLTEYVEVRIELLKYDLKEDLSKVVARVSVFLLMAFMGTFFLFFISMALAFAITRYLSMFWGFAIVSAIYVIAGLVIYSQRKSIAERIEKEIKTLLKKKK